MCVCVVCVCCLRVRVYVVYVCMFVCVVVVYVCMQARARVFFNVPSAGPEGILSAFHLQCPRNELGQTSTQRRCSGGKKSMAEKRERKHLQEHNKKTIAFNNTLALGGFFTSPWSFFRKVYKPLPKSGSSNSLCSAERSVFFFLLFARFSCVHLKYAQSLN